MWRSRFRPLKVQDIMHSSAPQTAPDTTLADAAQKMLNMEVGCLPAWENDELVGIITDRDIVCRAIADGRDPAATTVREVMSNYVAFCYDDQVVDSASQIMDENKVSRLPVLDHDKHLVGILTLGDLFENSTEITRSVIRSVMRYH